MKALYDLDGTVVRITPKWVRLAMKHPLVEAKVRARIPGYDDVADDVDSIIDEYDMCLYFGFNEYENKLFCSAIDEQSDFYDEWTGMEIPRFGIADVDEIVIVTQSDGESLAAKSKIRMLESWKREGKIADWTMTSPVLRNKAEIIRNVYGDYDFLAEDHPRYPIQICKTMERMKIRMVEYPYNRETVKYLKTVYPDRLL